MAVDTTMMLSEYERLRDEFLSVASPVVDERTLHGLKLGYYEQIRSKRKLGRVRELRGLVHLLEKYDMLGHANVDPLCDISKRFISQPDLQSKLLDYRSRARSMHCSLYNMYKSDNGGAGSNDREQQVKSTVINMEPSSSQEVRREKAERPFVSCPSAGDPLREAVLQHVSERIGRSWRDAARFLGVRECDIDAIENKYPFDLKRQSYAAFTGYFDQCTAGNWKMNLVQVLEKVRRRDLRESVERMLLN